MATEAEALAKVESTFPMLDTLRTTFATAEPPAAGSMLANADAIWPRLPFSEHARQALASAWDHFDVVRLTVDARRLFPTGLNGVLRGGLLASAMALWLLGPDEPDARAQRGLIVSDEWYHRRIQYQRDLTAVVTDPEEQSRSQQQLLMLQRDRDHLRTLRTDASQLQATSVIAWSAENRFGSPLDRHVLLEWRRLGGDAHALGWQLMLQNVQWANDGITTGPVEARITGDFHTVAEAYIGAWCMFTKALGRFDELNRSA